MKQKNVLENIIETLKNPISINEDNNKERQNSLNCDSKIKETKPLVNEKLKNKKKLKMNKKDLKEKMKMNEANLKEEKLLDDEELVSIISNINVDGNIYNVYNKILHVIKYLNLKYHYKESNANHIDLYFILNYLIFYCNVFIHFSLNHL